MNKGTGRTLLKREISGVVCEYDNQPDVYIEGGFLSGKPRSTSPETPAEYLGDILQKFLGRSVKITLEIIDKRHYGYTKPRF